MALTRRQREIYEYVRAFVAERGYSPSLEEIGEHFGLSSVATVHKHVQHLVEKGQLRKAWNRSRSLEPVEEGAKDAVDVPLLGVVAAGAPIEAIEVPERITLPSEMVRRASETFVLRVRGDSMIEEQIRDGDYVIVENRQTARDGEMVIALLEGENVTLKKLFRESRRIRLQPANSRMKPIYVRPRDLTIQGVVIGVLRKY